MVKKIASIASAGGIEIYAGKKDAYSFYASPYQAHRDYAAVDIRQNNKFGEDAYSPVSGTVVKTLKFESPTITGEGLPEYLIIIKSGRNIARIMHAEPTIKAGEKIAAGDVIGKLIKNGFFSSWVDPTLHVEVRKPKDYIRARGGLELTPEIENGKTRSTNTISGVVKETSPRNVTVETNKKITANVGEETALIDGATNIDYAGVFGKFDKGKEVKLGTTKLGGIISSGTHSSLFSTEPLYISVNNISFGGIHFTASKKEVKLLPKKYGETGLRKGQRIKIRIENVGRRI